MAYLRKLYIRYTNTISEGHPCFFSCFLSGFPPAVSGDGMQWGKRWAFSMGHRRASVPLSLLPLYFFDPHVYERFIFQIFPFICRHFIRIPDWCKTFRRTLSKRSSLLSQCCFLFRFYQQCQSDVCDLFCGWLSPAPRKRTLCVLSPAIGFLLPGKFLYLAFSFEGIRRTPIFYQKVQKKKSPRTPYRFLTNLTLN